MASLYKSINNAIFFKLKRGISREIEEDGHGKVGK